MQRSIDNNHGMLKEFCGIALDLLHAGSALAGVPLQFVTILLIRKNKFGLLSAASAGIIIMFFEFVEVLVIGSPAGPARLMQIVFFGLGTVIEVAAMGLWFLNLQEGK
jgi:hypothetical protein